MNKNVDEIYLEIAQSVVNSIDGEWAIAVIRFEMDEDSGDFDCTYKNDEASSEEHDFDVDYNVYRSFKNLHEITSEGGNYRWNSATFTIFPSGKFNIKFEWDQGLTDEIAANS